VSTLVIVWILTALAALVVVLTRLRLAKEEGGAGQFRVGDRLLLVHTVAGASALVVWVVFLVAPGDSALGGPVAGIVALALWWVVVVAGLLILMRWLPARGRHASSVVHDTWSEGPGLSVLAHVGMLVGVLVFTWAYLTSGV
jgi:hypothetical protein